MHGEKAQKSINRLESTGTLSNGRGPECHYLLGGKGFSDELSQIAGLEMNETSPSSDCNRGFRLLRTTHLCGAFERCPFAISLCIGLKLIDSGRLCALVLILCSLVCSMGILALWSRETLVSVCFVEG